MRLVSLGCLHPTFRVRIATLQERLLIAGIPLRPYETGRTPARQAELFARGRDGKPGGRVTKARAWESLHQYGLSVDFVFFDGNKWSWNEPEPDMWQRYTSLCEALGLETLSFEKPHVQLPWSLADLQAGHLPPHGDAPYLEWLSAQVTSWGPGSQTVAGLVHPGAPPISFPPDIDERPEMVA